ncbi:MAG: ABC transporter substrate-binding protein [Firmicutes bacterium]|nr:ABC transporter substrate-binding protein [Bacillota bacterium]
MLRKIALALVSALLLTACSPGAASKTGGASGTTAPSSAPAPKELKKVSLMLDWYPNAVHSFIYAAIEQGYFKAEGIDVDIRMPADDPTEGIKLVGTGKETFAFYYQADTLLARAEGVPVVSVAAVVRHPLNGIMVRTAGGIKSPRDLEGKRIGYAGTPEGEAMIKTMVKTAGGDPAKVKITNVGFDLIPALATKKVDALNGAYINHEQLLLEKQGIPITYFNPAKFGVPDYYELVLITGEQTVKNDPEMVKAFWGALSKGQAWVEQNSGAALKRLLSKQDKNFPLDQDVETRSLQILLPLMTEKGVPFGLQTAENWQATADWLVSAGMLKPGVKVADAFVNVVQ